MKRKPIIFTKARIGNIMAAVILIWGFLYFTGGLNNGQTGQFGYGSSSEVIAGMMGFAAKHLWDVCTKGE